MKRELLMLGLAAVTVVAGVGCKKKPKDQVAKTDDAVPKPEPDAATPKPADETVKIGVIRSATGNLAPYGEPVGEGLELAIDELNKLGGVRGKKIELVIEDDGSDPQRAVKAFEKLASIDKVAAVIGPTSSDATRATAPLAEKFGIIQVTPTAHDSDLAELPNTFVLFPTTEQVAERTAKIALEKFKAKRVAVINPANKWGEQSTSVLRRTLTAGGAKVVATETFKEGDKEFGATMQKIRAARPQVLIYPGYYDEETLALTRAALASPRPAGGAPRLADDDVIIIIIVGAACRMLLRDPILENPAFRRNIYIVDEGGGFAIPGNERSAGFQRTFNERFKRAPSPYAAAAHAALFAVKDGLETASETRKLSETLRNVKTITAFGQLDFQDKGLNRGAVIELLQPDASRQLNIVR